MTFSRKVFCGATNPLRLGILQVSTSFLLVLGIWCVVSVLMYLMFNMHGTTVHKRHRVVFEPEGIDHSLHDMEVCIKMFRNPSSFLL